MLPVTAFRGKRVLIFGLGLLGGGQSVARWFAERDAQVTATDLRAATVLGPTLRALRRYPIRYVLGQHRRRDIEEADLIIKNPGVPDDHPLLRLARRLHRPVENETSIFFTFCPAPIIGVTGTKGKSTTAALTSALLHRTFPETTYGGNYGIPALDLLGRCRADQPAVLELSSWQLEGLQPHRLSPHIAVLTNILPDHLNRYRSFKDYANTKRSIAAYLRPGDAAVLNADDPECRRVRLPQGIRPRWFSTRSSSADAFFSLGKLFVRHGRRRDCLIDLNQLPVQGEHFIASVLAASLAAEYVGAAWSTFHAALRAFNPLPGRQELVRIIRQIAWINDTTATAPVATLAALAAYSAKRIVLVAGGVDKQLPVNDLALQIRRRARALVLLPGTASEKLHAALRGWHQITDVTSMNEAVKAAKSIAQRGDVVLLSPAAASFNLFQNEYDRGQQFRKAVLAL